MLFGARCFNPQHIDLSAVFMNWLSTPIAPSPLINQVSDRAALTYEHADAASEL